MSKIYEVSENNLNIENVNSEFKKWHDKNTSLLYEANHGIYVGRLPEQKRVKLLTCRQQMVNYPEQFSDAVSLSAAMPFSL